MTALAIDTTTDRLSVAARRDGRTAGRACEGARRHAAELFPLIDAVFGELGCALPDVQILALSNGPGSFTGLRVGAAAMKALTRAQPTLSVWSASNLMVRAAGVAPHGGARVLVVTSALRGEIYAACYRLDLPHLVETVKPPTLTVPEALYRETADLLVADAPDTVVDRLADRLAIPLVRGTPGLPSASALLDLLEVPGGADRLGDVEGWEPVYGRMAEAQVRWEAAHGRPLSNPSRDDR